MASFRLLRGNLRQHSHGVHAVIVDMSTLIYNKISIPYIHTQKVEQECFKDPSNSDVCYWRFCIRVEGVIRVGVDQLYPRQSFAGVSPADIARSIRHELMVPRRPLYYGTENHALINVAAAPADLVSQPGMAMDARNGPMPLYCNVRPTGTAAYIVEFGIETWIVDCGAASIPPRGVSVDKLMQLPANQRPWVSHRWSESITLDDTGRAVEFIRNGLLITRSDMFMSPDQLRGVVSLPLERAFRRKRSSYTISEDNLTLAYQFVDEEVYLAPPRPAYRVRGTYSESSSEGMIRYGEVFVELTGGVDGDKSKLLNTAIAVALHKLKSNIETDQKTGAWIGQVAVDENMYEPVVSVRVRAMLKIHKERTAELQIKLDNFSVKPYAGTKDGTNANGDERLCQDIKLRGSAGFTLVGAALNDPCLVRRVNQLLAIPANEKDIDVKLKAVPAGQDGLPLVVNQSVVADIVITPITPDDFDAYFNDTRPSSSPGGGAPAGGMYSRFVVHKLHYQEQNVILLPVCKRTETGDDPEEDVVEMGPPSHRLKVSFIAEKLGEQPKVPDPRPVDANMVLVRAKVEPVSVETSLDGQSMKYTITGEYVYGFKDWRKAQLNAALPPWMVNEAPVKTYNQPMILSTEILFPSAMAADGINAGQMFDPAIPAPIPTYPSNKAIGPGGNTDQT